MEFIIEYPRLQLRIWPHAYITYSSTKIKPTRQRNEESHRFDSSQHAVLSPGGRLQRPVTRDTREHPNKLARHENVVGERHSSPHQNPQEIRLYHFNKQWRYKSRTSRLATFDSPSGTSVTKPKLACIFQILLYTYLLEIIGDSYCKRITSNCSRLFSFVTRFRHTQELIIFHFVYLFRVKISS